MVGLRMEYTLCVSIYPLSRGCHVCHLSHVTCDVARAPDAKCANHLDHSLVGGGRNILTFKSSFVTDTTSSSF